MMDGDVYAVYVTDSRGKAFSDFPVPNKDKYITIPVVKSGYKLHQLERAVCNEVKSIHKDDLVLVFLAGGINDCTYRVTHEGGRELSINVENQVVPRLYQFQDALHNAHWNTLLDVATIPLISFKKSQAHYKSIHQLYQSKYTVQETVALQEKFGLMIDDIKNQIIEFNDTPQYLNSWGYTKAPQCYWHQRVQKTTYSRNSQGEKVNIKQRIPDTALPDGIHPSEEVAQRWYDAMHSCFLKMIDRMPPHFSTYEQIPSMQQLYFNALVW